MAPFHIPTSFKAFARTTRQDPAPRSPDSFHSPSAKLDEWQPVGSWTQDRTDASSDASHSARGKVGRPSNGDSSTDMARVNAIRDFVLPPLDFPSSRPLGSRSEPFDLAGAEIKRPSTAQAVRLPTESRTHSKGASVSRLNERAGSQVSTTPNVRAHKFHTIAWNRRF